MRARPTPEATGPTFAPGRESLADPRLWIAFLNMLLVAGLTNTWPVFLPALLEEFGGSRGVTALAVSFFWLGGAVLGPLAGYWLARHDPRWLVTAGLAAVAAGLAGGTAARSLPAFVLAVGVGGAIGAGLTGLVTNAALLADVYVRRRGLAIGIAFGGSMAGYVVAPPVQWVITGFGWRAALLGYGAAILALIPAVWRWYPRRLGGAGARAAATSGSTGGSAAPIALGGTAAVGGGGPTTMPGPIGVGPIVASVGFWSLLVLFSLPPLLGYLATMQHALYFRARGFSAEEASLLLAVGGALSTSGRALAGLAADRLGAPLTGFVSLGSSLVGMACLLGLEAWPSRALALGYVLFLFLPLGSRATIVAVLVSRIASPVQYGVVFGILGIGNNLGAALGPWLSGGLYDWTGSYVVLYLCAISLLLVALLALAVFCVATRPSGP